MRMNSIMAQCDKSYSSNINKGLQKNLPCIDSFEGGNWPWVSKSKKIYTGLNVLTLRVRGLWCLWWRGKANMLERDMEPKMRRT